MSNTEDHGECAWFVVSNGTHRAVVSIATSQVPADQRAKVALAHAADQFEHWDLPFCDLQIVRGIKPSEIDEVADLRELGLTESMIQHGAYFLFNEQRGLEVDEEAVVSDRSILTWARIDPHDLLLELASIRPAADTRETPDRDARVAARFSPVLGAAEDLVAGFKQADLPPELQRLVDTLSGSITELKRGARDATA